MARTAHQRYHEVHGDPDRISHGDALRALGLREDIHPQDVTAVRFGSEDAARGFKALTDNAGGTLLGIIAVYDLRPMTASVTDPGLPDDPQA